MNGGHLEAEFFVSEEKIVKKIHCKCKWIIRFIKEI